MWSIVIPVKRLAAAKTRLAGPNRRELALAVACDTVLATLNCPRLAMTLVVTDDPEASAALTAIGARTAPDTPDAGLNPALVHGAAVAARLRPELGVAALSADLPALRPAELDDVLAEAENTDRAFLADAEGTGTTLYAARPEAEFAPAFGRDSRQRHRIGGAAEITLGGVPSVRRDVDTLTDLRAAIGLGTGPHTAKVAARMGLG